MITKSYLFDFQNGKIVFLLFRPKLLPYTVILVSREGSEAEIDLKD